MSRSLRAFAVAVLFVALAAPVAARAEPWNAAGWLDRLLGKFSSIWADNGCAIDPNGLCGTAPGPIWAENGCGLDPDGHCGAAPAAIWADNGCSINPNGQCISAPLVNGCGIDPNGLCANPQ
ncbi:MAG TPA: hypothetical protein VN851_16510 [Thermoanaerobaculia bacterium]|nr:hypothetical protein [Thermoanaerobaculia bacterium]